MADIDLKAVFDEVKPLFNAEGDKVSMSDYIQSRSLTLVLEVIGIYPEDEYQLKELFSSVDTDDDGYISFDDFAWNL